MEDNWTPAQDRLEGAEAIAAYLGTSVRRARYLIEKGELPIAREGGVRIVASKRVLAARWRRMTGGEQPEAA
jgi:hypothetical protein